MEEHEESRKRRAGALLFGANVPTLPLEVVLANTDRITVVSPPPGEGTRYVRVIVRNYITDNESVGENGLISHSAEPEPGIILSARSSIPRNSTALT
jgi:hypothetical protein